MNPDIGFLFLRLEAEFNSCLDRIRDDAIAKFRSLAKSTGQRTMADRL
jgi:hypothetical protein